MDNSVETFDVQELHSIRSAARRCEVAPGTVRNWMLTGLLPFQRGHNRVYIRQADLDEANKKRQQAKIARKKKV